MLLHSLGCVKCICLHHDNFVVRLSYFILRKVSKCVFKEEITLLPKSSSCLSNKREGVGQCIIGMDFNPAVEHKSDRTR